MKQDKRTGTRGRINGKKIRYGGYSVLLTALLIAAIVVVNVLVGAAEDRWALKIDASPNNITAFSDQTYAVLDELDQDAHVYMVFENSYSSTLRTQIEEVVAKYRARNAHIIVDTIDPVREPNRINAYMSDTNSAVMSNGAMIVTNADETRVRLISASEMQSKSYDQYGYERVTSFNAESRLTVALMYVSSESTPKVNFLTGHDEIAMTECSSFVGTLESNNYDVAEITLTQDTVLDPSEVLIINIPTLDITEQEYQQIKTYLDNGGRMLVVEDSMMDLSKIPNFVKLYEYYGIQYKEGVVVESENSTSNWYMSPMMLVPSTNTEHAITEHMSSLRTVVNTPRALKMPTMPLSGYRYTELLTTSDAAYVKSPNSTGDILTYEAGDELGQQVLAMAVQDTAKDMRIVALGSVYLIADTSLMSSSNNIYFIFKTIEWLSGNQQSSYVPTKAMADTTLSIPNQSVMLMLAGIVVIAIPLLVLIVGIWVYVRRRRL